jgi:hypothetical protein
MPDCVAERGGFEPPRPFISQMLPRLHAHLLSPERKSRRQNEVRRRSSTSGSAGPQGSFPGLAVARETSNVCVDPEKERELGSSPRAVPLPSLTSRERWDDCSAPTYSISALSRRCMRLWHQLEEPVLSRAYSYRASSRFCWLEVSKSKSPRSSTRINQFAGHRLRRTRNSEETRCSCLFNGRGSVSVNCCWLCGVFSP